MPRQPELTDDRIRVAAGMLLDAEGRLLLSDRCRATTMQEYWEFPGGKLKPGETATDALRRELGEELGVVPESFAHFRRLEHDYPDLRVRIDFYLVTAWQGVPCGQEGQALRWISPSELAPESLLPADRPVLDALLQR